MKKLATNPPESYFIECVCNEILKKLEQEAFAEPYFNIGTVRQYFNKFLLISSNHRYSWKERMDTSQMENS